MSPTVDLANMVRYVEDNIERISALYREIEEVQYRFNDLYASLMANWQERVEALSTQLLADDLPQPLQKLLDKYQSQEQEALQKRIAELEAVVAEKRAASEKALADAQAEIAKLRQSNPLLNDREEKLKARSQAELEAIAKLEAEWKASGLLQRTFGNQELRRRLETLRQKHAQTIEELNAVRQEWQQKKQEAQTRQTELRAAWEKASVEASQSQAELDHLRLHWPELSAKRGAQEMLTEMKAVPDVPGKLRDAFAEIVEMNQKLEAYRGGLTSVAEALGLLTGIRAGMERFQQSLAKVYEEQRRFNLRPLKLELPRSVIEFHNNWAEFRAKVKDEKYMGAHPLEFSEHVRHYAQERLTEQAIEDMFDKMGRALTAATKAWDR